MPCTKIKLSRNISVWNLLLSEKSVTEHILHTCLCMHVSACVSSSSTWVTMTLYNYFKPTNRPDPRGSLLSGTNPEAMYLANNELECTSKECTVSKVSTWVQSRNWKLRCHSWYTTSMFYKQGANMIYLFKRVANNNSIILNSYCIPIIIVTFSYSKVGFFVKCSAKFCRCKSLWCKKAVETTLSVIDLTCTVNC